MVSKQSIYKQLGEVLFKRKQKVWLYVLGILWIAVAVQVGVNHLLLPKTSLLQAFVSTNTNVSAFELEMCASYGKGYLSNQEKENLVRYLADSIGLKVEGTPVISDNGQETEVTVEKNGKNADTSIKVVTLSQQEEGVANFHHYILVRLKLYENTESLMDYRNLLEKTMKELKTENIQTTMQLSSTYKGHLNLDSMNKIANGMIESLGGKIAYANREEELFTVYAYSGLLKEYVTSMGTKINIHIAIQYDKATDTTIVYLGTPVINGGY